MKQQLISEAKKCMEEVAPSLSEMRQGKSETDVQLAKLDAALEQLNQKLTFMESLLIMPAVDMITPVHLEGNVSQINYSNISP